MKFLSLEPLIGPLEDLSLSEGMQNASSRFGGRSCGDGVDWVIVGGESGPKARPMEREWVTSIFDQCRDADVPFFFKQWGGVRKDLTGRKLFGRTYDAMPVVSISHPKSSKPRIAAA